MPSPRWLMHVVRFFVFSESGKKRFWPFILAVFRSTASTENFPQRQFSKLKKKKKMKKVYYDAGMIFVISCRPTKQVNNDWLRKKSSLPLKSLSATRPTRAVIEYYFPYAGVRRTSGGSLNSTDKTTRGFLGDQSGCHTKGDRWRGKFENLY